MKLIPAGEFNRGLSHEWPDKELAWYPNPLKDDVPVKRLAVDAFLMDEAEVTNERYAKFVADTGRPAPFHWVKGDFAKGEEANPVINVSWDDAAEFCASEGKRLPTEAEWEKACRGGHEDQKYPWGNEEPTEEQARFGSQEGGPVAVCSTERNDYGLCDMIGNAWEWSADYYGSGYYSEAPALNPQGPPNGQYRVIRGGSWFDRAEASFLTCSYRSWARAPERSPNIGFRCARSAPAE